MDPKKEQEGTGTRFWLISNREIGDFGTDADVIGWHRCTLTLDDGRLAYTRWTKENCTGPHAISFDGPDVVLAAFVIEQDAILAKLRFG